MALDGGMLLAALVLAAPQTVVAPGTPQDPRKRDEAVVLVNDAGRNPIAGAHGAIVCVPRWSLPALHGVLVDDREGATPERTRTAVSDAAGRLRFTAGAASMPMHAGSGLVWTDAGGGALLVRLRPGPVERLTLAPMGAVVLAGGGELGLWARAMLPTGELVVLPPQRGTELRLPVGSYEAWISTSRGWLWQRLDLVSSRRCELVVPEGGQTVRAGDGVVVHPAGRPDLLLHRGGASEFTLLGAAIGAPLVTYADGRCLGPRVLPGPPGPGVLPWPPPRDDDAEAVAIPAGDNAPSAVLCSLQRQASGAWQLLASTTPRDGAFHLPQPPPGDTWLLLLAPDRAPAARSWARGMVPENVATPAGVPLVVTAIDDAELPVVDLALEYVPLQQEPALVAGHTDSRGRADLGRALAPGVLRVSDTRFANDTIELDTIPADGIRLTVRAGARVHGAVTWPDGAPARGVVVTVRDPSGRLRPAQRAVLTGDDGSFTFGGLPEERGLVVFATAQRAQRTWSARLGRARAGDEPFPLVLQNEDPQLDPPPGKR